MLPGSDVPADEGFARRQRAEAGDIARAAEAGVAALRAKMESAISDCVSDVMKGYLPIVAKVSSAHVPILEDAHRFREKIGGKLSAGISDRLSDFYSFSSRIGLQPPTPDDIAYANQTGDYLGSMLPVPGDDPSAVALPLPDTTRGNGSAGLPESIPSDSGGAPNGGSASPPWMPLPTGMPPTTGDDRTPIVRPNEGGPFVPDTGCKPPFSMPPGGFRPFAPQSPNPDSCNARPSLNWVSRPEDQKPVTFGGFTILCPLTLADGVSPPSGYRRWCPVGEGHPSYPMGVALWAPPGWFPVMFTDGQIWLVNNPALSHYAVCYRDCTIPGGTIPPPQKPGPGPIQGQQPCIPLCVPQCPPCDDSEGKPDDDKMECAADDEPEFCDDDKEQKPPLPGPEKEEYCEWIDAVAEGFNEILPDPDRMINFRRAKTHAGGIFQRAILGAIGIPGAILPSLTKRLVKWLGKLTHFFQYGFKCDRRLMAPIVAALGLMRFLQKWTGVIPHQTINATTQASNFVCQSEIPTVEQAHSMYLKGELTKEDWECIVKANGHFVKLAERAMKAQRHKPTAEQYISLHRRGHIDEDDLLKLLETTGVIESQDKVDLQRITESWPTQSDVNRYMVRDVADDKAVDWTAVDKLFEEKHKGRVKKWYDALGVPLEARKDHFRAHFHLPSFTMGAEMFHRLRQGVVDNKLVVDEEKLRNLLIQDDWHPDWVDRLIAISYKPVTRTDAVRAYMIHAIDDEKLRKLHLDWGYNPESADFYVAYHKRNREILDRRRAGFPTLRMLVNQYARCELTENQFKQTMAKLVVSNEQAKASMEAAKLQRSVGERKMGIRTVQRPFALGLIDRQQATEMLAEYNIDSECVTALLNLWESQALKRDKYLSASQLCKMRERNIIDAETQIIALIRQGWKREDAMRIAQLCSTEMYERATRRAEAQQRRVESELRRRLREAEKARRLAECGPPACPSNTPGGIRPKEVD